jgi:hypothetical protein
MNHCRYGRNVLLELGLAERGSVGRDEDELSLATAQGLESAAVAQDDLARLDDEGKLFAMSVTVLAVKHLRHGKSG